VDGGRLLADGGPLAAEGDGEEERQPILRDVESPELSELTDPDTLREVVTEAVLELAGDVLARLPLIVLAIVVFVLLLLAMRLVVGFVRRTMIRSSVDFTVRQLVTNLLRLLLIVLAAVFALAVAGVEVGALLAGLGLIGLGLALALQNILENFIAGVVILLRKPYSRGEVIVTNEVEGFVEDIDLRVTTIRSYDGTLSLLPNADIYTSPLTNLSRRGTRRSTVRVGVDYRDDHELAKEVLWAATVTTDGVLADPPPVVLLVELGESSVDFEVYFWTDAQPRTVVFTRDAVTRACKSAIEEAGLTIPWPIRTLAADRAPLELRGENGHPRSGVQPPPPPGAPPGASGSGSAPEAGVEATGSAPARSAAPTPEAEAGSARAATPRGEGSS
jgi:small conductance mechanosensitive channel